MPDQGDWIEPPISETLWEWGHEKLTVEKGKRLDEKRKWKITFTMWNRIVRGDDFFMGIVQTKLAKPCQVILLSLLSWYRSEYDHRELTDAAWDAIQSYSMSPDAPYQEWRMHLETNLKKQVRDLDHYDTSSLKSDYQMTHAILWIEEMTLRLKPSESYGELQHFRRQALEAALVQRFSWFIVETRGACFSEEYGHCPNQDCDVLREMARQDSVTAHARLDACPWINNLSAAGPRFLYDIDQARTVEITQQVPPYAVISHSWGRWATGGRVQVQGVSWLVPQNRRFAVESLPSTLQGQRYAGYVFEHIRYVWIDLLCIPQDEGYAKRSDEIKNQAQIFRGATVGYVWMNNVTDWIGAASGFEEICLLAQAKKNSASFHFNTNACDALWTVQSESRALGAKMQLFGELRAPYDDPNMLNEALRPGMQARVINGWFSSLQTLQEYGLRPDMQILDSRWKPLTVCQGKCNGLKVTVGALGCLARILDEEALNLTARIAQPDPFDKHATASKSLETVLQYSRLGSLQTTQRSAFLCASGSRGGSGEQYESMMSITGATEWFRQCNKDNGYDPARLQEQLKHKETFRELLPQDPTYNIVGTLLPIDFTAWSCRKQVLETCPLRSLDHKRLVYWTFNKEGLVDMGRAGILASSDTLGLKADPDRPLRVHLKPFATNNVFSIATRTEEVELREYLNNNLSWWPYPKYAIILKTSGDTRGTPLGVGVILAELPSAGPCGKKGKSRAKSKAKSKAKPDDSPRRFGRLQTFQLADHQPWYEYTVKCEDIAMQDLKPVWVVY